MAADANSGAWPETAAEYISSHLSNNAVGQGLNSLHLDTLLISWALAALMLWLLSRATSNAVVRNPSRGQICCEMLFEFFDRQVRDLFPNAPPVVAPMAITIFIWVFLMNCMDLVPVDLVAAGGYLATGTTPHLKLVPTTDLSLTAAMAISVFALTMYYNFKNKGAAGFAHEVATAPFGKMMAPVNILLRFVEELAKPLSLSMRLFGNLFAAEMIFLLIAAVSYAGTFAFLGQWIFGGPWAIYHILVVPLQAYIFAILTVVYLAMAHEKH